MIRPIAHTSDGTGCYKCARELVGRKLSKTTEEYLKQAVLVHKDRYDYSKVQYINNKTKIEVVCKKHGSFFQLPSTHLKTYGCSKCSGKAPVTLEKFLERAKIVHKDRYDYSKVILVNSTLPVEITCLKHGSFFQPPVSHTIRKHGCPKCSPTFSKPHQKVVKYLEELGFRENKDFEINKKGILEENKKLELDIWFPEKKLAIEVDGVNYHGVSAYRRPGSEDVIVRDALKTKLCQEKGINLLRFTDLEINKDWESVCQVLQRCLELC